MTEWFPVKERAFAIGIFNAGANIGAIITPLVVPLLTVAYGWRAAFVITGVATFGVADPLAGHVSPADASTSASRRPSSPTSSRTRTIRSTPMPWLRIAVRRETWAYALGKFCIDPIWWFFLFWLPGYLGERYDLNILQFGPPLVAIYLLSDVGSVVGGWASSRMIKAGRSVNFARKMTMLGCAFAVTPMYFAQSYDNLWVAVLVIGVATAAHQAFSANLYTLPSDLFPRSAVGSVIGIGGTAGAVGGMLFTLYIGQVLERIGSYTPIFIVAGSAYFIALRDRPPAVAAARAGAGRLSANP